ncbi:MAG: hypothetical protein QW478_05200 [Candidatus Micrarchaeaceae archaeon]
METIEDYRQKLIEEIKENIENLRKACNKYAESAEDLFGNEMNQDDSPSIYELEDILSAIKLAYMNQKQEIEI